MEDEKVRILICHTDGAVMELPDYAGPPEHDDTLNYRISQHRFGDGTAHVGNLAKVKKSDWEKKTYRDAILDEVAKATRPPGEGAGFGQTFYDVKANFQQDALDCWKKFNRPTDPSYCDYRKDNKRLYPDTKGDRKELGLDPKDRPNTFLCDFCPVQSIVMQKQRKAAGQYD